MMPCRLLGLFKCPSEYRKAGPTSNITYLIWAHVTVVNLDAIVQALVEMASGFPHNSAIKNPHPAEVYSSFFDVMRYDSPVRENIFE